jgi:hypothetical protein
MFTALSKVCRSTLLAISKDGIMDKLKDQQQNYKKR